MNDQLQSEKVRFLRSHAIIHQINYFNDSILQSGVEKVREYSYLQGPAEFSTNCLASTCNLRAFLSSCFCAASRAFCRIRKLTSSSWLQWALCSSSLCTQGCARHSSMLSRFLGFTLSMLWMRSRASADSSWNADLKLFCQIWKIKYSCEWEKYTLCSIY